MRARSGADASLGDDDDEDDEDDDDYEDEDDDDDDDDEDADWHPFRRRPRGTQIAPNGRLRGWDWFPLNRTGTETGRALARSGAFGKAGWPGISQLSLIHI